MRRRNRQDARPSVQRLEARELPSAIMSLLASPSRAGHGAVAGDGAGQGGVAAEQALPPNPLLFPSGVPSPRQSARQAFVAHFVGPFSVGPGQFSSQAQELYIRGAGGSNQFLH